MRAEWVGWVSALILLLTITSQVRQQWRSRSIAGVSPWLFIGQMSASFGFVIYSFAVDNLVFVLTNSLLLMTAIFGQCLYLRNRRMERRAQRNRASDGRSEAHISANSNATSMPP